MRGSLRLPSGVEDYYIFTTVRHPFERTVSIWHALTQREAYRHIFQPLIGGNSFLEFARWLVKQDPRSLRRGKGRVLLWTQSDWLKDVPLNGWLHIENVNEEFNSLPFVTEAVEVPKLLAREHATWKDVACDESRALLSEWLRSDFELFSYDASY